MIDPITAFTAASAAFTGLKKIISVSKDVESMTKQMGDWYNACSDINRAESQRKNPTFLERMSAGSDNIDAESIQILMHKKTNLEREKEIKFMLDMKWGFGTYQELTTMRKQMRDERREQEHNRIEAKRQIANNAAIMGLSTLILGFVGGGIYLVSLAV